MDECTGTSGLRSVSKLKGIVVHGTCVASGRELLAKTEAVDSLQRVVLDVDSTSALPLPPLGITRRGFALFDVVLAVRSPESTFTVRESYCRHV